MQSEKRTKVLFITKWYMNRYDPQNGVFIRKHASAAALYCDVALLCILSDPKQKCLIEFEEKEEYGVKSTIVYFRKSSSFFSPLNKVINLLRYLKAASAGLKRIRETFGDHDITHAYIMFRPALIAWWLRLFRGKPFVISEQWSGYATGRFQKKNIFEKFLSRWIFRNADAVTAVSEFLKNKMIAYGLTNDHFIITNNVVEPLPLISNPLSKNDHIKALVVADLKDDIKNISGVINAISEVVIERNNIELHIIGHGEDEQELKDLASEKKLLDRHVFFHGVKKNEEVFQYLYACDFLVMNSRFETFSLICAEAMACGKPVIATRCGGPEEFVTPETGILITPNSQEALKKAILTMMDNYSRYDSEFLKNYAINHFSQQKTGQIFNNLYHSLI